MFALALTVYIFIVSIYMTFSIYLSTKHEFKYLKNIFSLSYFQVIQNRGSPPNKETKAVITDGMHYPYVFSPLFHRTV